MMVKRCRLQVTLSDNYSPSNSTVESILSMRSYGHQPIARASGKTVPFFLLRSRRVTLSTIPHFLRLCYDTLYMTECGFSNAAPRRRILRTAAALDHAREVAALA